MSIIQKFNSSATYNGADCGSYFWSQSLTDLEIVLPVPASVVSSKHVQVLVQIDSINVLINVNNTWKPLLSGKLTHTVDDNSSIWTLDPSKLVQVSIEKSQQAWWSALLISEKPIKLGNIDRSVKLEDLPLDTQTIVHNMTTQQYLKLQQSSPLSLSSSFSSFSS